MTCLLEIVAPLWTFTCFSGSDDLSAKLWDVRTGQCIYGIQTHTCATVKFDEQKLVTGSFDNTVACWEWSTGAKIQQFRGHTGAGWSQSCSCFVFLFIYLLFMQSMSRDAQIAESLCLYTVMHGSR